MLMNKIIHYKTFLLKWHKTTSVRFNITVFVEKLLQSKRYEKIQHQKTKHCSESKDLQTVTPPSASDVSSTNNTSQKKKSTYY